jgi:hypothetical protein
MLVIFYDRSNILLTVGYSASCSLSLSLRGSAAFNGGCWMGLQDAFGTGYYNWRDPSAMLDISFRNWRRGSDRSDRQELEEPGTFINNGDNCVHLVPWLEDPVIAEQGSMEEVSCFTEKAFVCQRLVSSSRYTITVEDTSIFTGEGGIRGGNLILNGYVEFDSFFAESSATITAITAKSFGQPVVIRKLVLRDGSDLILNTNVLVMDEMFIGERMSAGIQPSVRINSGFTLTASTNCTICNKTGYNVTVNARFEANNANIVIQDNVNFVLSQGGELSSGNVTAVTNTSRLSLGGYSTRLATYDSFDVRLAHRLVFESVSVFATLHVLFVLYYLFSRVHVCVCICVYVSVYVVQRYRDRRVLQQHHAGASGGRILLGSDHRERSVQARRVQGRGVHSHGRSHGVYSLPRLRPSCEWLHKRLADCDR